MTKEQQLVLDNLGLINVFYRRYCGKLLRSANCYEYSDLLQQLRLGLVIAINRWDPTKGCLSTYAFFWMRACAQKMRFTDAHLSYSVFRDLIVAKKLTNNFTDFRNIPNNKTTIKKIRRAFGHNQKMTELVPNSNGLAREDPNYRHTIAKEEVEHLLKKLSDCKVTRQPARLADIIRRRFGIGYTKEQSLEEVGRHYGVTRQRIEQMELQAMEELTRIANIERVKENEIRPKLKPNRFNASYNLRITKMYKLFGARLLDNQVAVRDKNISRYDMVKPRQNSACGNPECKRSTGIHEGLTFGSGELDEFGYWEKPCRACAELFDKNRATAERRVRKTLASMGRKQEWIDKYIEDSLWLKLPAWPYAQQTPETTEQKG